MHILYLEDNPTSYISWVRKTGNKLAHELIKWDVVELNKHWSSNFPICILNHMQRDMGVTIYFFFSNNMSKQINLELSL
jgi:hypothetical protein